METVQKLTPEEKAKNEHQSYEKLSEYLTNFMNGMTNNTEIQEGAVKFAIQDLKAADISDKKLNDKCNTCHGRGFTGYNSTYNHLVICNHCFPPYENIIG